MCGFAVATVDEGIQLRRHGIAKPVIILGKCHESRFEEIVTYDLEPAVFQFSQAEKLSEVALRFAANEAGTAGRVKRAGETETAGETGATGEADSPGSARGKPASSWLSTPAWAASGSVPTGQLPTRCRR